MDSASGFSRSIAGQWALYVIVSAVCWWSLDALPARLEIDLAGPPFAVQQLRLPFVLRDTGVLSTGVLTYRCRFRKVYDLESGVRVPRVPTRSEVVGRLAGRDTAPMHCNLLFATPRPVALDLEIIVTEHGPRGKLEAARQRFCVVPGTNGTPVWTKSSEPCDLGAHPAVARIEQNRT